MHPFAPFSNLNFAKFSLFFPFSAHPEVEVREVLEGAEHLLEVRDARVEALLLEDRPAQALDARGEAPDLAAARLILR